jgi:anti-sigma factor RsiW
LEHIEHLLGAYHDGELPERARKRVEAHLRECPRCREASSRLRVLSRTLRFYAVPDPGQGAEQFRAQVVLRLKRRSPAASGPSAWWYLVPVVLSSVIAGLLALSALPELLRAAWAVMEWLGVEPGLMLEVRVGSQLSARALALLRSVGTLAWEAVLLTVLLPLFGSYVGWVGALWRTETQRRSRRES